ncbi:MAG: bifunctional nuclease family protein [Candidatus Aenigmatarchaeota archaeon]
MSDDNEKITENKPSMLAIAAIVAFALLLISPSDSEVPEIPVENEGFVEANVFLQNQNLELRHNCDALTMTIGVDQARSIQYGLNNELWERPGSHDLMVDALRGYDVEVVMARVHDLQDGAYIADLYLEREETVYRLDSRPSDAVAVALRADAPIQVNRSLLEEYGRNIC